MDDLLSTLSEHMIVNVIEDVFYQLLKVVLIAGVYYFGKHMSDCYKPRWKNYFLILGIAAFLSIGSWGTYGTHLEDAEPFVGGYRVTDFEPTDKERNEHGLTIFFTLSIPALYGVYNGIKKK
jgi:hypothetical protein